MIDRQAIKIKEYKVQVLSFNEIFKKAKLTFAALRNKNSELEAKLTKSQEAEVILKSKLSESILVHKSENFELAAELESVKKMLKIEQQFRARVEANVSDHETDESDIDTADIENFIKVNSLYLYKIR